MEDAVFKHLRGLHELNSAVLITSLSVHASRSRDYAILWVVDNELVDRSDVGLQLRLGQLP